MIRSPIEFEVREPTGLGLGTYDLLMIRQKIYTGDLHAGCEYQDEGGRWRALGEYPAFNEVFWLRSRTGEEEVLPSGQKVAPRIAGWEKAAPMEGAARPVALPAADTKGKGLLGRFFGKS